MKQERGSNQDKVGNVIDFEKTSEKSRSKIRTVGFVQNVFQRTIRFKETSTGFNLLRLSDTGVERFQSLLHGLLSANCSKFIAVLLT